MHDSTAGPRSFFPPLLLVSRSLVSASVLLLTVSSAPAVSGDEELVRQLARPVPTELVLPFQNDWDFRVGPLDEGTRYRLKFEPVLPISIGSNWNILWKTSLPYVSQENVFDTNSVSSAVAAFPGLPGVNPNGAYPIYRYQPVLIPGTGEIRYRPVKVGIATGAELIAKAERKFNRENKGKRTPQTADKHQDGLGDIVQSFYLSPKQPTGGWDLGFGPALLFPSATDDRLGNEKWGAGPTAFAVRQKGGWTYGVLANHLWSFAGNEDRRSVNATYLQPFVAYSTRSNTTFALNAESNYDWNESEWTVPLNFTVAQLVRIGSLPVQFQVGARYYVEGPSGMPEWGLRFTVSPIFAGGPSTAEIPPPKGLAK